MNKKGVSWSAMVSLAIMAIVLYLAAQFVIPPIYKLGKSALGFGNGDGLDSKTKEEINAETSFSTFFASYETCMEFDAVNCLCDQFDAITIPKDYSIRIENLDGAKTRIEFYSGKPAPEKAVVKDFTNFCIYKYDRSKGTFSKSEIDEILLNSEPLSTGFSNPTDSSGTYKIGNKVQLFRIDRENICLVSGTYESKDFDEILRLYTKCSLKGTSFESKAGILDIGDFMGDFPHYPEVLSNPMVKNEESSAIVEQLSGLLLENVGKVTRITEDLSSRQTRIDRRKHMFAEAYNNFDADKDGNKDGKISDNVYVISIRSVQIKKEDSKIAKDYFKIHYLQGSSASKELAQKIGAKLQEVNGKLMKDNQELKLSEADERYRLDFQILYEENSKTNTGPVFLACESDYSDFIACREKILIPAVFIDVVEVNGDGHYMFEGHQKIIVNKIYEGIKFYLGK